MIAAILPFSVVLSFSQVVDCRILGLIVIIVFPKWMMNLENEVVRNLHQKTFICILLWNNNLYSYSKPKFISYCYCTKMKVQGLGKASLDVYDPM